MPQVLQEAHLSIETQTETLVSRKPESRSSLLWIVLAALAIRLAVLPFLLPEQIDPSRDHWEFGYEAGRIARSLAQGQGFSSPLFGDTGPTAWMTPVYPLIMAGVFKLFGVYTAASAVVLLSFNALISALTAIPIFFVARQTFSDRAAKWAGWAWAFFPYAIYFPMERMWETWLATLFLSLLFFAALQLEEGRDLKAWAGFGFLSAAAALTCPAICSLLPVLGGWVCYRRLKRRRPWFRPAALSALVFVAAVSPWFIRNYQTFHRFIPFRDNMGMVLRLGTRGTTNHWAAYELGPWHNDAEWEQFQRLGELGYMAKEKRQAIESIRRDPRWFAWTSLRRAFYLWTGYWSFDPGYLKQEPLDPPNIVFCTGFTLLALVGLWRALRERAHAAALYALVLAVFPAIYYFTSPEVYYRRPLDPLMVILAASLIPARKQVLKLTGRTETEEAEPELVEA
ncbi:MAG TPA: glycosyltransferase family 39 protein [Candidatus Binatia bacterium]|nr:glycosyltransferase family 39 protein [Candidatus Binatia bacterium]